MAIPNIYAGPGKFYRNGKAYFADGENGEISFDIEQEKLEVASALTGFIRYNQGDAVGRIKLKPFSDWDLLPEIYPDYLGASHGASPGSVVIGSRLFGPDAAPIPGKIWVPGDGRSYTAVRTGILKPPSMHLGVGVPMFDEMEVMAVVDMSKKIGDAACLYTHVASGAADPGGDLEMANFVQGEWIGSWGAYTGMEAEEEWVIVPEVKYQLYKKQKVTILGKLISVRWMVKVRLVGPTHAQLTTALGLHNGRLVGSGFGTEDDLSLEHASGKSINFIGADVVGAGFEFGGQKLGTGEVGFVNSQLFEGGDGAPLIEFSADA